MGPSPDRGSGWRNSARGRRRSATNTQTAADELSTVRAQLSDLEEKQRPSRDAVNRQAIVAPIAGPSGRFAGVHVGRCGAPGERLLDIVPDSEPLLIEARVGLDDIDDVRLEQPADIRLTAYPIRTTPLLHGVVHHPPIN